MEWVGEALAERGVREQEFRVECDGRSVPGVLWMPGNPDRPVPLVLLGHGGSGDKRQDYLVTQARRLVRHHGLASAAIDGPVHGSRRPAGDRETLERTRRAAFRDPATTTRMVADWKAALDALSKLDPIRQDAIGYWGLSMGTMYGLPFVAAEPRVSVAVLGLMGEFAEDTAPLSAAAATVRCPVRFLVQWDDELIERRRALELFDALGTPDKTLHANPGIHVAVPPEEMRDSLDFLARKLS
jgi:fermentation-respiration switch protein FrsA (DUF1100 family)